MGLREKMVTPEEMELKARMINLEKVGLMESRITLYLLMVVLKERVINLEKMGIKERMTNPEKVIPA
jgi:hypothetical protein